MTGKSPSHAADAPEPEAERSWTVLPGYAEERVDRFLCIMEDTTRQHAQALVDAGCVRVGGRLVKASYRLTTGEEVTLDWKSRGALSGQDRCDADSLLVLHEDDAIVVLDKRAGDVVHPGGSYHAGTVAQLAERRFGPLATSGGAERPGIVHRLDRETSGVLALAKTDDALVDLQRQFRERETEKEYLAIVHGTPRFASEWIHAAMDRDLKHPERMRAVREGGKEASTYYEVAERFGDFAALRCYPKSGRTHQIRVHMALVRLPIVGDALYPLRQRNALRVPDAAPTLERHALHARALTIMHPLTRERMRFEAPVPADLTSFLEWLRSTQSSGRGRGA